MNSQLPIRRIISALVLLSLAGCSKIDREIEIRSNNGVSPDVGLVADLMEDTVKLNEILRDCPVSQRPKTVECASALLARSKFMYQLPKIEAHNGFTGKL